ncbi:MAG: thiol reductant ABC exporter subunit CydC [Armatimonadota bacterium]|nr:thiol reductant ABC exporter subunit CydC [Armatimonadota bacterium]MDR5703566.1 thiol reductant ABC exporter subunit CydC [Armatimonadota bacterium]
MTPTKRHNTGGTTVKTGSGAILLRLLGLLNSFAPQMLLAILLSSVTVASGIGLLVTSAYLIAAAALHPPIAALLVPVTGVRFFGIARGVFRYLERYVSHAVTFQVLAHLRVWFYQAVEPLAPARLMKYHSADLLNRVAADIEELEHFFVRVIAPPAVAGVVALGAYAFLAWFDLRLAAALLLFFFLLGGGLTLWTYGASQRPAARLVEARSALRIRLVDAIVGMPDIIASGGEQRWLEQIRTAEQALANAQTAIARIGAWQGACSSLLVHLGAWIVLVLAIASVEAGRISGLFLAAIVLGVLTSFEAVIPLPHAAQALTSGIAAARRIFRIADASPAVVDSPAPVAVPSRPFLLRVSDLRFRYDRNSPWTLDGVSFDLAPGRSVAIVGPSGAGKSTLIHLLLRFWEYEEGSISLNGIELRRYAMDEVRRLFSVVPERPHLFNASIRENLLLANPTASEAELIHAAERAKIHAFIQSLPRGYETQVGERGMALSGGERQRLAIARALLRDAPMLLLDEPTANLDAVTERQILETLHEIRGARAMLLVTHRLVGMEAMDEILVLDRGRIVERGCHADLLARGGLYRKMWDLQHRALSLALPSLSP